MSDSVSVTFDVEKSVFEQSMDIVYVLNPDFQENEKSEKLAKCSYLQERLEQSIETHLSNEEFLEFWQIISHLRVIKISEIFKIPLTNNRKVCLKDVHAWDDWHCTLSDEDKYPLLKAILDISIQKFEDLVME
jgi:hypothetical protein